MQISQELNTDPMLDVALSYMARIWPVFPCRAADEEFVDEDGIIEILATKTPLTSNGFRGATLNERIVRELWRRNPGAMIGVPTGAPIGAWVLDIDPKHGGPDTLTALEAEHGALPATLTAETTSGGRHYFFKHKAGVRNRGALGAGIDVRGDGGYVIAAGSVLLLASLTAGWSIWSRSMRRTGCWSLSCHGHTTARPCTRHHRSRARSTIGMSSARYSPSWTTSPWNQWATATIV